MSDSESVDNHSIASSSDSEETKKKIAEKTSIYVGSSSPFFHLP